MAVTQAETAERFARTMGLTSAVLAVLTVAAWWLLRPTDEHAESVSPTP